VLFGIGAIYNPWLGGGNRSIADSLAGAFIFLNVRYDSRGRAGAAVTWHFLATIPSVAAGPSDRLIFGIALL
jgi:hypothetical protein